MRPLQTLSNLANWKTVMFLGVVFTLFTLLVFPNYQNRVNAIAGEEVEFLDTRHSYTLEEVETSFEKMGMEGRATYAFMTSRYDMIYPVIYGSFFIFLLTALLQGLLPDSSKCLFLALFPISIVALDYLENVNTLLLLDNFPENLTLANVDYGAILTANKHRCVGITLMAVLGLSLLNLLKKVWNPRKQRQAV